jgi:transaldolase
MKFFLDTANVGEIREATSLGLIDGVTTNPSLVAREERPFEELIREICEIVQGPVSAEVVATETDAMVEEARRIAAIHEHVVVKCPLTRDGLKATRALSDDGIRVNVTLCFSPTQALLAAKAGAAYISPFVGRLDDISYDGMALIQQIMAIYENYGFGTEVLVASVRHPKHIVDAALMGADVATIPFKAFDAMFNHPLTDKGLAAFLADWEKAREVVAPEAVKA